MKKITLTLLLFIPLLSFTQAELSPYLSRLIKENNLPEQVEVILYFKHQVNYDSLNNVFNQQQTPLAVRQKKVIQMAQNTAKASQERFFSRYSTYSSSFKTLERFWIVNMLHLQAEKSFFLQLLNDPSIVYIEEFDRFMSKPLKPLHPLVSSKAVNGIEPGLAAINAPAMWQMGYTGKARKIYSIDTGVWKDHPAIKRQFLGNYKPIAQAWHGIDAPYPVDKSGSHGTHTVGTELGLDKNNNDTIGVAFNAYYMVSDPIVTNINDIKPLIDYINVFQFALNPDGDTATTDDIPDVINNSWGISNSHDTSICAPSYVSDMFDAIQAAGIANVFSAGNEGPGDTTIGMPQYVVNGLVNTFTVGALDGNNANFPIASFSSRGPTACPSSGSLAIKPEVAAPGVNVRSCVDTNNYAIYSGTSMAGPHVSGAVLLLKEAFPQVPGEQILLALYYSAIDLGQPGEDNTYGMGMIDVLAAYNYLAQTYTPVPPDNYPYDVRIVSINNPSTSFVCLSSVTPQITIENYGQQPVTGLSIEYQLDSSTIYTQTWIGNLLPAQQVSVGLPAIPVTVGSHELRIKISLNNNFPENDYIDNQRIARFKVLPLENLPFIEQFEQGIDSSRWVIENYDYDFTWDTAFTAGLPWSNVSIQMPFTDYNPKKGQTDALITPLFDLPNSDSLFLSFTYAYNKVHNAIADTLAVYIVNNCGTRQELWKKGGDSLTTTLSQPELNFIPDSAADWDTAYINLSVFKNNRIFVVFEGINESGNNLYLDNIKVYQGEEPQSIREIPPALYTFYPNPAHNVLHIAANRKIKNSAYVSLQIFNNLGMQIYQKQVLQKKLFSINVSNFTSGIYFLKISSENNNYFYKFIKQ